MAMFCDGCGDDISRLDREECHIPLANRGGIDLCPDCEAALDEEEEERWHVVCRDCEFENIEDSRFGAYFSRLVHERLSGHTAAHGRIDGGADE